MASYQVVEDVALMQMYGDEGLKLSAVNLRELLSCDLDQLIQHLQKLLVHFAHYLLVLAGTGQSDLSVPCPDELDPQYTHLRVREKEEREMMDKR